VLISKQPRVGRAPSQLARGGAYTAAGPGYNLSWCVKPKLDKVRSHIRYSAPKPTDRPTVDFDKVGRVGVPLFEEIGVPPDADFYICGPAAFMSGLVDGLASRGFARDCLHTENFGSGQSKTPGIAVVPRGRRIRREKPRRSGRLYPLRAAISLYTGVPHSTACSN
jgi:hypothetical protein